MELFLGIDMGTSYFKLGLFGREGNLRGLGRVPVKKNIGQGTLCELPPDRFWSILQEGLRQAMMQAGCDTGDIKSVGYSSQAGSFMLLDENDSPLTPLILWPDARVERIPDAVNSLFARDDFLQTTGLGLSASSIDAISQIIWLREKRPDIWAQTHRIMTISDYLTYSLTGQSVGDAGTAALLGILDVKNLCWWQDALDILAIPADMLSTPLRPGSFVGNVSLRAINNLGLKSSTKFFVGSLDHHMAAIGAGMGTNADVSESTGTVLACIKKANDFQPAKDVCCGPGIKEGEFFALTVSNNGASVLEWYRNQYAPGYSVATLVEMAESVPAGCDGLVALPQANSFDDLQGFKNIKPAYGHGFFVRAIMESITKSLAELVEMIYPHERPKEILATGGGAKSHLWLEMKSELLNANFIKTNCDEPACKGAAMANICQVLQRACWISGFG